MSQVRSLAAGGSGGWLRGAEADPESMSLHPDPGGAAAAAGRARQGGGHRAPGEARHGVYDDVT